jgi:hypothetical protein
MQRPGNIHGFQGITPRYMALGSFGKGVMAPPPTAPGVGVPAKYIGGQWQCEGNPPPEEKDGYYHCCPGGWTKTPFSVLRPCGKDFGQTVCGPLPEGVTTDQAVCCENLKEWAPADPSGGDPCQALALASGRAVPGVPETILADELMVDRGPLISPVLLIGGGLAIAALFIVTIVIKLKS